ncbi:MAG: hypothetical protein [Arizlama microvirus]|nr:MAG: hypothetical protein [Arizlama microvirus]
MGMYRKKVNKQKSARTFKKNAGKTAYANLKTNPMRGGIRL